jgi:formate dehydrogenase maturation protein FdhE
MGRADPDKRPGNGARDDDRFVCPACASEPLRVIIILDTSRGRAVRLFKCECGELIWDD